jgi:predicted transcriptional regulator
LIAARSDAGIIQAEVAAPMATITSVVSRLESGRYTLPTLRTIE